MTKRQIEELAKLFLDIAKLIIASLVLGFFQSDLPFILTTFYSLLGLTFAIGFITMGLQLLREVR